jgi:hypothetical protein
MHRFSKFLVYSFLLFAIACGSKSEPKSAQSENNPEVTPTKAPAEKSENAAETTSASQEVKIEGTVYGGGVDLAQSVAVSDLLANPDLYAGQNVRIEGVVSGVCPKRGCWIDIAGNQPGQKVRFKVRDGVMVFPMADNGKYAVAQGVVRKMPMTLEQSKNYAAYQAREYGADMDPDKITEPLTLVRLDGTGAVIRAQP